MPSGDVEIIFEAADMVKPKTVAKVKPKLTVKEKVTNKNLVAKIDYSKDAKYYSDEACTQEITQQDLVVGKTLWAKITLKGNYDDGKTSVMKADFRLCNKLASGFKVEKIEPIEYTGKEIRPSLDEKIYITVKENGATKKVYLQENVHYTVEYPNGENIKVGKGKVMVHGIGEYGGSKTISFNITKKSVKFDLKGFLQEWFSV